LRALEASLVLRLPLLGLPELLLRAKSVLFFLAQPVRVAAPLE
jgi:hypothetical protein